MTADPRPFTLAAEGTGPSELDYQGPQGWATVVHHAHQGSFTLIGAGNTQLVRDREHEEWRTVEPRTWEYRVGLSGPQRLRIEEAERWSISVTPLERDEVEDGGVFSRRGIGEQRVEIVKPGREGAAILEFTKIAGEPSTRPALFLLTEYGRELEYLSREDIGRTDRARFLIDADVHLRVWSPSLPTGQVMVVQADNCEWRLRVLPLSAARPVETITTGAGADVLVHRGPPGAVTLRQEKHWAFVRMRGFDMEPGDSGIVHSAFHVRPSESDLIGVGPEPTLIQITGDGGWELHITPSVNCAPSTGRSAARSERWSATQGPPPPHRSVPRRGTSGAARPASAFAPPNLPGRTGSSSTAARWPVSETRGWSCSPECC